MPSESFPLIQRLSHTIAKPIAILDTETTGLLGKQAVGLVELAVLEFTPDNHIASLQQLINPGMPIPWQATKVHGITDRDVAKSPSFSAVIPQVSTYFQQAVIAGYNSRCYDIPVLQQNVSRYDRDLAMPQYHLDIRDLWIAFSGSKAGKLGEVAAHYNVMPGEAHRAMGDVLTTARLLEAMLWRHGADFVLSHIYGLDKSDVRHQPQVGTTSKSKSAEQPIVSSSPTKTQAKSAVINAIIQQHIEQFGKIIPADYPKLASKARTSAVTISFQLSTLLGNGELDKSQLEDPQLQQLIEQHLERAIHIAGDAGRLKPIKEALDGLTRSNIDYVQLRIALANRQ